MCYPTTWELSIHWRGLSTTGCRFCTESAKYRAQRVLRRESVEFYSRLCLPAAALASQQGGCESDHRSRGWLMWAHEPAALSLSLISSCPLKWILADTLLNFQHKYLLMPMIKIRTRVNSPTLSCCSYWFGQWAQPHWTYRTKYISWGTKNISFESELFDSIDFEIDSFFVQKSNKPIGTFASSKKHLFVDQWNDFQFCTQTKWPPWVKICSFQVDFCNCGKRERKNTSSYPVLFPGCSVVSFPAGGLWCHSGEVVS
jgi:hypothetical protein